MSNTETDEVLYDIVAYNLNPYVLALLVVSVSLWAFGYTEYATPFFVVFLFVISIRNVWFAYLMLFE